MYAFHDRPPILVLKLRHLSDPGKMWLLLIYCNQQQIQASVFIFFFSTPPRVLPGVVEVVYTESFALMHRRQGGSHDEELDRNWTVGFDIYFFDRL
jgi:hypothetical protein